MEHLSRVTDLACCHHLGTNEEPDFKMSYLLIGGNGDCRLIGEGNMIKILITVYVILIVIRKCSRKSVEKLFVVLNNQKEMPVFGKLPEKSWCYITLF